MASVRMLNGYKVVFAPEHPRAMKSANWEGYVYEHILVATESAGRQLRETEVVHHLDLNRENNLPSNLLILDRDQHTKLHAWLLAGAPTTERGGVDGVNSVKAAPAELQYCPCGLPLVRKQGKFCSNACAQQARKQSRPSKEQVLSDLAVMYREAVGRKYGVSGTAVKK